MGFPGLGVGGGRGFFLGRSGFGFAVSGAFRRLPGAVAQVFARQAAFEAIEHLRRFAAFISTAEEFGVAGDVHLFEKDVE